MGQEGHRHTVMLFAFGVEMSCTIAIGDLHIMQRGGGSVMGLDWPTNVTAMRGSIALDGNQPLQEQWPAGYLSESRPPRWPTG